MKRRVAAFVLSTLVVTGCGGGGLVGGTPTIDATDTDRLASSMTRMRERLDDAHKTQLAADILLLTAPKDASGKVRANAIQAGGPEAMKPLQGLTAEEIHAKAEQLRESSQTPKAQ